ncbi:MAG: hypothetical protein QOC93_1448 [Actinomycetota bacterium]|jgi:hypothetical protein|nr:hypothetical protein [Actinomycetota bacterium]
MVTASRYTCPHDERTDQHSVDLSVPGATAAFCRIDLRELRFVEPLGLVEIAARAEYHRQRGTPVRVHAPTDPSVANYLARMRLGRALTDLGAAHDLPYVRERDLAGRLLELTYFAGTERSDELAAMVYHRVSAESPASARALYTALCEVGQNVREHAGVAGGWAAAQATTSRAEVWFAIGDCGIGIRRSLATRGARDDADALMLALDRGVSRLTRAGRGNGLAETCRLVTARGGRLHLVSGAAARTAGPVRRHASVPVTPFPGTLLAGSLPYRGSSHPGGRCGALR